MSEAWSVKKNDIYIYTTDMNLLAAYMCSKKEVVNCGGSKDHNGFCPLCGLLLPGSQFGQRFCFRFSSANLDDTRETPACRY